ncbi:MAG: stalk domain-containing protein [Thermincolia bacterium]
MGRNIGLIIGVFIMLATPLGAWAGQGLNLLWNGKVFPVDVGLRVEKGTTLAKVRPLAETLGSEVAFHSAENRIVIKKGQKTIELTLGSAKAQVNGKEVTLAQKARVENGRTLVPLRAVAEALGYKVTWSGNTNSINIVNDEVVTVPFHWQDGKDAWREGLRQINGDWYGGNYSKHMNFAVITKADHGVSMPPLKILLPILPPKVDYNKYVVLFGYLGEANTGGHGIYFEQLEKTGQEVLVKVRMVSPAPDMMVTQALTYPSEFIRVPKDSLGSGSISFTFVDQKGNVLKQTKTEI